MSSYVPALSGGADAEVGVRVGVFTGIVGVDVKSVERLIGVLVNSRGKFVGRSAEVDVDVLTVIGKVGAGDWDPDVEITTGESVKRSGGNVRVGMGVPPEEEIPLTAVTFKPGFRVGAAPPSEDPSGKSVSSSGSGVEMPGSVPNNRNLNGVAVSGAGTVVLVEET